MYRIGVIGDRESVLGFKAVGLEVFPCDSGQEARKIFREIADDNFAIIYVTEALYREMEAEVTEYTDKRLPAVIPVPDKDGSLGIGLAGVKKSVERAVGADILFGGDK